MTFTLVGNLADFGADPRAGVQVRITGTPRIKVDDGTIYSDQPETVTTDSTGAFTADLISTPGLWYRVSTPFVRAVNPVHVAAYIPDPDDPTTGTAFAAGVTVDLADVMDEDPTPGYDGVFLGGGGGGVTDHAALTGRSTANSHPISAITGLQTALDAAATDSDLTTHAADTTAVHGITDTAALVVTTDPRLTDARTPSLHAASHGTGQADAVSPASIGAAVTGHTHTGTYAPVLGADDNYVTDAEKVKLSNLSGTNTGDQTLPTWTTLAGKPSTFPPDTHTHTASQVSDSTTVGRALLTAADAAAARTAIGAGTSSLAIGTTAGTAAEGNDARLADARTPTAHTHPASGISDSTATGRAVLTAATQADARAAIGAGTSSLVVGTGAGDAKAGNYQPTAANISDSTATGRAVVTATDAAAARTAIGAGTLSAETLPASLVDAKGDLLVGTAADTVARLAVGATNGHVLTVDSAQTAGIKWATPAGGGASIPDYTVNGYQTIPGMIVTGWDNNGISMTTGNTYHTGPYVLTQARTLSNLDGTIQSGVGGAKLRVAVVKADAATLAPTALEWQSGEIDASAYSGVNLTMSVALTAGTYMVLLRVSADTVVMNNNWASSLHYPPPLSLSGYRTKAMTMKTESYGSYASPPAAEDGNAITNDGVGDRRAIPFVWRFSA